jgi:hypothetical protein
MVDKLHRAGLRSGRACLAGFAGVGVWFPAWAPVGFGLVNALRT